MTGPELHISGGVGGTYARYEDLYTLAGDSDDLAGTLASITAQCHAMLADPNLLASAVLDPAGAARFEQTLLSALDGRHGLTALAGRLAQRSIGLRAAAASYQAADEASAELLDFLRWRAGNLAGTMIASDPLDSIALNSLGYMLAERRDRLDEAVTLLQRALKVEPDNPSYLDSLGWAYFQQGRVDLADAPLTEAAEKLTTSSVVQDHLGDLRFRQQRYSDAAQAWQRALDGDGQSIDRAKP